jgi:hypothetical protein
MVCGPFGRNCSADSSETEGELHHFTADMDTRELTLTWREGEVHGWTPFPYKAAFISQIEDQFAVRLFDYCGVRPARHCAPRMTTSLRVSLAISIGRPVQSSPLSKRARMMPRGRVNSLDQIYFVAGFNALPIFTR